MDKNTGAENIERPFGVYDTGSGWVVIRLSTGIVVDAGRDWKGYLTEESARAAAVNMNFFHNPKGWR